MWLKEESRHVQGHEPHGNFHDFPNLNKTAYQGLTWIHCYVLFCHYHFIYFFYLFRCLQNPNLVPNSIFSLEFNTRSCCFFCSLTNRWCGKCIAMHRSMAIFCFSQHCKHDVDTNCVKVKSCFPFIVGTHTFFHDDHRCLYLLSSWLFDNVSVKFMINFVIKWSSMHEEDAAKMTKRYMWSRSADEERGRRTKNWHEKCASDWRK